MLFRPDIVLRQHAGVTASPPADAPATDEGDGTESSAPKVAVRSASVPDRPRAPRAPLSPKTGEVSAEIKVGAEDTRIAQMQSMLQQRIAEIAKAEVDGEIKLAKAKQSEMNAKNLEAFGAGLAQLAQLRKQRWNTLFGGLTRTAGDVGALLATQGAAEETAKMNKRLTDLEASNLNQVGLAPGQRRR